MGIVNVTPNSFSDGTSDGASSIAHGIELLRDGADILDIGGEASNPHAASVDAETEWRRVAPVIEGLRLAGAVLSIDTTKCVVAKRAVQSGCAIVNDIACGAFDDQMVPWAATEAPIYLGGHLRGQSLREVFASERPVSVDDVVHETLLRIQTFRGAFASRLWFDPGLGFGKGAHGCNWDLLRAGQALSTALEAAIVVGPSRKRFLKASLENRDVATAQACIEAIAGGAHVVRVHNVRCVAEQLFARTLTSDADGSLVL